MGTARFPLPENMLDIISLLNASRMWNLTLVEQDESKFLIDGDQLIFTADNSGEAQAFLAGCFIATYMGNSLDQILYEIQRGRFSQDREWDEINKEVENERRYRHSE